MTVIVKNVAPIKEANLVLDTPITVIYGASSAGKTTLINIIDCMFQALYSDSQVKECLKYEGGVLERIPMYEDTGYIEVLLELDEHKHVQISARIQPFSATKNIKIDIKAEGIASIRDVRPSILVIPENRHVALELLCTEWNKYARADVFLSRLLGASSDEVSDFDRLLRMSRVSSVESEYDQTLKLIRLLLSKYHRLLKPLHTILSNSSLSRISNTLFKHILSQWLGRPVSYVDVTRFIVDSVPICEESFGARELFIVLPVLIALIGIEPYQRLGSPSLITIDSVGLGLTRKETLFLALALIRLWEKLRSEVENLNLKTVITSHSELLFEAPVMESISKGQKVDELLKMLSVSLLPEVFSNTEYRHLQPEDYKVLEFVPSTEGSILREIPDYIKNVDRTIFEVLYGK